MANRFWRRDPPKTAGLEEAKKAASESRKRLRELKDTYVDEVAEVTESLRAIRMRNHLGEAALQSMMRRDKHHE